MRHMQQRIRSLANYLREKWRQNRQDMLLLPWGEVLMRVAADLILVNASLFGAAGIWAMRSEQLSATALITGGRASLFTCLLVWSVVCISVFHFTGFYSRTRGYATGYKALVIARAVSLSIVIFIVVDHFFLLAGRSRPVAIITWLLMLAATEVARFGKDALALSSKTEVQKQSSDVVKRVLVLGGAGYLGSTLMPMLLAKGYKVRLFDSFLFGRGPIEGIQDHPDLEIVQGDVRDIAATVDAMKGCDAIIDLAAIVGDPACEEDRRLAVEINRAATRMLIDVARGHGIKRFIFASSCSVYGASDFLMDEYSTVSPISTYAQTKVDSEKLLRDAASPSFHTTTLRLGTLFGLSRRPRLDLVVNLLTARAASTGKITIFNGQQWRPFLHVTDAARAFVLCLEANPVVVSGEIFNVGDYNLNYRLTDVSDKVASIVPHVEVAHVDNGDKRNYRVSFDKIHSRLGFRCQVTLEQGIGELYEWAKAENVIDFAAAQFNNQTMTRHFAKSLAAQNSTLRVLEALAKCV